MGECLCSISGSSYASRGALDSFSGGRGGLYESYQTASKHALRGCFALPFKFETFLLSGKLHPSLETLSFNLPFSLVYCVSLSILHGGKIIRFVNIGTYEKQLLCAFFIENSLPRNKTKRLKDKISYCHIEYWKMRSFNNISAPLVF